VLYSPIYAIGAYLALGLAVLASRLLFPKPKATVPATPAIENEQQELPKAA